MQNTSHKILNILLSFKRTLGLVAILAIALAIPVTLVLNQNSQTLLQQAAEPTTPTIQNSLPVSPVNVDVNADGIVDNSDYSLILSCISEGSVCGITVADLNGDGVINTVDYQELLSKYFEYQNSR